MQEDEYDPNIDMALVQKELAASAFRDSLIYLDSVASTMDIAHSEASSSTIRRLVILAEEQTSGRGRFKRDWISPKYQNLYLSILMPGTENILRYMSIAACLATSKAIEGLTSLKVDINWPNDLTVAGKKLAGILVEQVHASDNLSYGVIGIGININMDTNLHPEIAQIATSIRQEMGHPLSRELVLIELLKMIEEQETNIRADHTPVLEWKRRLVTLGRRITLTEAQASHTGKAVDVDEAGNLVMELDDKSYITLASGDVTSQLLP